MQVYLRDHDWGNAFQICRVYGVDPDIVYRARWAAAPVSKVNIADNLARMADRKWVVRECLTRAAADYESQRALLNYGLKETSKHAALPGNLPPQSPGQQPTSTAPATPPSSRGGPSRFGVNATPTIPQTPLAATATPGGSSAGVGLSPGVFAPAGGSVDDPDAAWFRARRLELWQHSDRLETLYVIQRRSFDQESYESFRSIPLPHAAAAFAATCSVHALQVLLQRHPHALGHHLLQLLSALPETLDPRQYSALLPRGTDASPAAINTTAVTRRPDWVECMAVKRQLEDQLNSIYSGAVPLGAHDDDNGDVGGSGVLHLADIREECNMLLQATEQMIKLEGGSIWPPVNALAAWHAERALQIDSVAGQLPLALNLLELAGQKGVTGSEITHLVTLGRVLAATVKAWWPADDVIATANNRDSSRHAGNRSRRQSLSYDTAGSYWNPLVLPHQHSSSSTASTMVYHPGQAQLQLDTEVDGAVAEGGDERLLPPAWAVTLSQFATMNPGEQVQLVLQGSTETTLDRDIDDRCEARFRAVARCLSALLLPPVDVSMLL